MSPFVREIRCRVTADKRSDKLFKWPDNFRPFADAPKSEQLTH